MPRRLRRPLTLWAALSLSACSLQAEDLQAWTTVSQGADRLAGYLADPQRPLALRLWAAQHLFDMGQWAHLIDVLRATPAADRPALLAPLAERSVQQLAAPATESPSPAQVAQLAYALLEFHAQLDPEPRAALVTGALQWALPQLHQPNAAHTQLALKLLSASTLADETLTQARLTAWLDQDPPDVALLPVAQQVQKLRSAPLDAALASALRRLMHRAPAQLTLTHIEAALANGHPELLRTLLRSVADQRVPFPARALAMNGASQRLQAQGLPLYLQLIGTDEPQHRNQVRALAFDLSWQHGGLDQLAAMLAALPAQGHWPQTGARSLRAEAEAFCETQLSAHRAQARPALLQQFEGQNGAAKSFALACVLRLYPEAIPDVLLPYLDDPTPLVGWTEDEAYSLGRFVQDLLTGED